MVNFIKKQKESAPVSELNHLSQDQIQDVDQNPKIYNKCPYLGLKTDPATIFNYPSNWNFCYRAKPEVSPSMLHQQDVCLKGEYASCPVFSNLRRVKLPEDLTQPKYQPTWKNRTLRIIAGAVGLLLILLLGLPYLNNVFAPPLMPDNENGATKLTSVTLTPTNLKLTPSLEQPLITENSTKISETEELPTAQVVETAIVRRLDIPIGGERKFIVHQVLTGESLEQYAETYSTTRDAIVELNYLLPIPLWINWLVVIPINFQEISDPTTFEAYIVTQNQISAQELAEKFAIDINALRYFNNLAANQLFYSGDVVIIPREGHFFD